MATNDETFTIATPGVYNMTISMEGKPIMVFWPDGTITVTDDAHPSITALQVIEAMRHHFNQMQSVAIRETREECARLADGMHGSDIAAAIRKLVSGVQ